MAFGIPSVFVEDGEHIEEELDEENYWVTVRLTHEMCHTHTDAEIMEFVANAIRTRRAHIGERSLYRPGNRCISFWVEQYIDDDVLWYASETAALHILTEIEMGNLAISRRLLFGSDSS